MHNVTISLQDDVLKAGRQYAKQHHLSLNALIRELLQKTVMKSSQKQWLSESFQLMAKAKADSRGKKWKREDLYNV